MNKICKASFIAVALLIFVASAGLAESPSLPQQLSDSAATGASRPDVSMRGLAVLTSRIDVSTASSSLEQPRPDASGGDAVSIDLVRMMDTGELYLLIVCCLLVAVLLIGIAVVALVSVGLVNVEDWFQAKKTENHHKTDVDKNGVTSAKEQPPVPTTVATSKPTPLRRHVRYLILWLVGVVFLCVAWKYPALQASMRVLGGVLPWLVIWSTFMFVIWVVIGDRPGVHRENFKPYGSIWVGFALAILTVFLVSYASHDQIKEVSRDLRGAHVLDELEISVLKLSKEITATPTSTPIITDTLRSLSARSKEIDQLTEHLWRFVPDRTGDSWPIAVSIPTTSTAGILACLTAVSGTATDTMKIGLITVKEPLGVSHITTDTVEIMARTSASISSTIASLSNPDDIERLGRHAQFMKLLIDAEQRRMKALDWDFIAPFIVVSVFYAVFLLFPWIVLLLFLLRKSEFLTRRKYAWLRSLHLLYPDEAAVDTSPLRPSPSGLAGRVFLTAPPDSGTPQAPPPTSDSDAAKEAAIRKMTFENSEYVISLGVFTGLAAVMWYLFFYPLATAGLIQLAAQGGGLYAFAEYLSGGRTPLMSGYLGAYIFFILLLLRRYFAKDVTPKVYVFADVRVIMVLLLGVVLQLIAIHNAWSGIWTALVAFAFGVFPMEGLQWILQFIRKALDWVDGEDLMDKDPLTKLDGINIWHEERLYEEGIDNIQNLANASIGQLILHLNWSPERWLDWVDQAVLYDYAKEPWYLAFEAVGIRTATALLDWRGSEEELAKAMKVAMKAVPVSGKHNKEATTPSKIDPDKLEQDFSTILTVMIESISKNPNITILQDYRGGLPHQRCACSRRIAGAGGKA